MQVVVFLVHLARDATRRLEGLARHRSNHFVHVGGLGFLHGLLPHIDTDVSGFHRVVGQGLVLVTRNALGLGVVTPLLDECGVVRVLDAHEVVPCSEVPHQRLGVHTTQLFFTHREGDDRNVLCLQAGVTQLFVERNVGITIDGGDHGRLATGGKLLHIGHDGLVIRVAEGGVFLIDVSVLHTLALEIRTQDLVGGAGVDIVGTEQHPALGATAVGTHQIVHRRNSLLIGRGTGIEHILGKLFAFILHRVEQQAVELFHHR